MNRHRILPWTLVFTSAWLVGGGYLDGWAHSHGRVDQTFFTPWHAVLYAGYGACAGVLLAAFRRASGSRWGWTLPSGYGVSLAGALIFAAGGLADLAWHLAFGIETDTAALLSPTHLVLYLGAALIVTGPLRAAWHHQGDQSRGWVDWLPVIASLAFLYAVLTFVTQFAHPLVSPEAAADASHLSVGSQIYSTAADGSRPTPLVRPHALYASQPAWSPDGRHLAFTTWDPADHTGTLSVSDADGSTPRVLVTDRDAGAPQFPAWSPDGRWIAFVAVRDGQRDVFILPAAGGDTYRLTTLGIEPERASWSPDGTRLAFTADRAGRRWVYVIGSAGQGLAPLVAGVAPSWSPDGARLAFGTEVGGAGEIASIGIDGSGVRQLTFTTSRIVHRAWSWAPAWSPDGAHIAFQSNRGGTIDVFTMNADGGGQVNLTDNPSLDSFDPAWSPDGQSLAFTARGHATDPSLSQSLGVASIVLQEGLLVGLVLLVVWRWRLPPGTFTSVLTLDAILLSFLNDTFALIPAAVLAGLATDLLLWRMRQARAARVVHLRLFATAVPVIYVGTYFVALAVAYGMGWSVHLWAGSVVLAGAVGWLVSLLVVPCSWMANADASGARPRW